MSDKLKSLIKGIGLPETILTDIEKDDFDAKAVIASFNESQKAHFKPLIENEIRPDIESDIREETTGKWMATLNNDIKKLGVPIEKIKDLKSYEKIKVLHDTLVEKYKSTGASDDVVKFQEENVSLKNQLTDWEAKFNGEVDKVRKEENGKTISKLVDLDLQKKFTSIPADRILGKKHSDGIYLGLKSYMSNKYDFALDEKDNIIPFEKGTSKRVQGKNTDGKEYFVPIEDLLLNSLKELNLTIESNGGEGSGQQGNGSGNGQKQKSARLLEMEAAIKQS